MIQLSPSSIRLPSLKGRGERPRERRGRPRGRDPPRHQRAAERRDGRRARRGGGGAHLSVVCMKLFIASKLHIFFLYVLLARKFG